MICGGIILNYRIFRIYILNYNGFCILPVRSTQDRNSQVDLNLRKSD